MNSCLKELKCGCSPSQISCKSERYWTMYGKSVWYSNRFPDVGNYHMNYSGIFHPEIPKRLMLLYSHKYQTVLDCFGGIGTTAIAAKLNTRNSISLELDPERIKQAKTRLNEIPGFETHHKFVQGDNKTILGTIDGNSCDLVVTSPPYFNILDYSKDALDIGNIDDYDDFMSKFQSVLEETHRVLKPESHCCLVVGDVVTGGFRPFPFDVFSLAKNAKFKPRGSIVIVNGENPNEAALAGFSDDTSQVKSLYDIDPLHELVLIFKKSQYLNW
jgi:DNA modification methylase